VIIHSTGMSHKFGPIRGLVRDANFRESPIGEVRRILFPRNTVNKPTMPLAPFL
jgi:hypothetical protein